MPRNIKSLGGDTVTVTVERNGIVIYKRDAVLSSLIGTSGNTRWKIDDTEKITVPRNQSPLDIAKRLLNRKGSR